jgi:hypothetical protein
VVLQPLRHVAQHPIVIDHQGLVHRLACPSAPVGEELPKGTVLERITAPTTCTRCWPELHLWLGRPASGQARA